MWLIYLVYWFPVVFFIASLADSVCTDANFLITKIRRQLEKGCSPNYNVPQNYE